MLFFLGLAATAALLLIFFRAKQSWRRFRFGRRRSTDQRVIRPGFLPAKKPEWVEDEVLGLKALMPDAGCRTIAAVFNRIHEQHGTTVGKSWVARIPRILSGNAEKVAMVRREIRSRKPRTLPRNAVGALDLTTLPAAANRPILGMIDHGTRACLTLRELPLNSSIAILRFLLDAFELYGKPKALRSVNGSTFTSRTFRFALSGSESATSAQDRWTRGKRTDRTILRYL